MKFANSLFLEPEKIKELCPSKLPYRIDERYLGGGAYPEIFESLSGKQFATIASIYTSVGALLEISDPKKVSLAKKVDSALTEFAKTTSLFTHGLKIEKYTKEALVRGDHRLNRFFLELVGGPYFSICGLLYLIANSGFEAEYAQTLYYHSRDYRKILRSLLPVLDPLQRKKDEVIKRHSISLLEEKWKDIAYQTSDAILNVQFRSEFNGDIAERCVEFAEVDRIFYHLVNNSLEFANSRELSVQVIENDLKRDLIWVFSNTISAKRKAFLDKIKANGHSLFEHDLDASNSFGMAILAEAVAHAYGLESPLSSEKHGYVGIAYTDEVFRIWFHWPKVV